MKIDSNILLKNNIHENSLTKTMKTFKIKVNQTWEEIYEIEAESEKDAVYLSVSDWIEPVKSTPTKSDIIEVTEL